MITRWSFSSLKKFETCPYQFHLELVEKIPKLPPPADSPMLRGSEIHEKIENHITGKVIMLPATKINNPVVERCAMLYPQGNVEIEVGWAFTQNWQPTDWNADNAWLRARLDVFTRWDTHKAEIIDWKTGTSRYKDVAHTQQMQLYSVCAKAKYPELTEIETALVYVDEKGANRINHFVPDQIERFQIAFHRRAMRMTTATELTPKPSIWSCKFCDYGTNTGNGACEYDQFAEAPLRPPVGNCAVSMELPERIPRGRPWDRQNTKCYRVSASTQAQRLALQSADLRPEIDPGA